MAPLSVRCRRTKSSENVSPISSVPAYPPACDALFSLVSSPEGSVNSNAPKRLKPKIKNTNAIKLFTHGLDPNCTTPKGPATSVTRNPSAGKQNDNSETKTIACFHAAFCLLQPRRPGS